MACADTLLHFSDCDILNISPLLEHLQGENSFCFPFSGPIPYLQNVQAF